MADWDPRIVRRREKDAQQGFGAGQLRLAARSFPAEHNPIKTWGPWALLLGASVGLSAFALEIYQARGPKRPPKVTTESRLNLNDPNQVAEQLQKLFKVNNQDLVVRVENYPRPPLSRAGSRFVIVYETPNGQSYTPNGRLDVYFDESPGEGPRISYSVLSRNLDDPASVEIAPRVFLDSFEQRTGEILQVPVGKLLDCFSEIADLLQTVRNGRFPWREKDELKVIRRAFNQ